MYWVIFNTEDDTLLWSNELGWTEEEYDTFTEEERYTLNLPMGGCWFGRWKING